MNKLFMSAIALGMLGLSSCSNDDAANGGNGVDAAVQEIILDLQDTDVLAATKSRPLLSTDNKGAENVTKVILYAVNIADNKVTPLPDVLWGDAIGYTYGRKKIVKLATADRLVTGTYRIVAVGQDETTTTAGSAYTLPIITGGSDWAASTSAETGTLFTTALTTTAVRPAEVFSGQTVGNVTVAVDGGFTATVLLKRQVAGALGYFSKIPFAVDKKEVKKIRLVSSVKNSRLNLDFSLAVQTDDATETDGNDVTTEKVINGFTPFTATAKTKAGVDAHTMYEIDLASWFSELKDDGKGLIDASKWAKPTGSIVAAGSVLAGEFVIPFGKAAGNTFELQLLGDAGVILKAWNVKLDAGSKVVGTDDDYIFNIYRNHLYQIGKRGAGDNPENPGENPDEPQPLNKDQDIIIQINDQWEFIHDMGIE